MLFALSIEVMPIAIILIPVLILYNKIKIRNIKKTLLYLLFSLYLAALYSLTGLPTIKDFSIHFSGNLIPFYRIVQDWENYFLNVLLFIPLGIFIPCLWKNYRTFTKTTLTGFIVSLSIELLQIFTYRATDINDLIANVAGSMIGYYLANCIMKKINKIKDMQNNKNELYVLYGIVIIIMAFIQPFISIAIWKILL